MSNWYGKTTSINEYMRRPSFKAGVRDARSGKPWKTEADYPIPNDLVAYERGRHFGTVWKGPIWSGKGTLMIAQRLFQQHLDTRVLL